MMANNIFDERVLSSYFLNNIDKESDVNLLLLLYIVEKTVWRTVQWVKSPLALRRLWTNHTKHTSVARVRKTQEFVCVCFSEW
jgi:hypothetical protein